MKSSTTLKDKITSIAIGGFDGIHLGHQALINSLDEEGAIVVIEKEYSNLTPKFDRKNFVKCEVFIFEINEIKDLNQFQFIKLITDTFVNLEKIVVGYDFKFGKDRACDTECLKSLFKNVQIIKEVKFQNKAVHSKIIRDLISNNKIKEANRLLNRNYRVIGEQIRGQGIGKKELFATINLKVKEYLLPSEGIYATLSKIKNKKYPSVSFIGNRLSTDNSFAIETHLLDIKEIEVKGDIEIEFVDFIRENQKFDSLLQLKEQISLDIKKAKEVLNDSKAK